MESEDSPTGPERGSGAIEPGNRPASPANRKDNLGTILGRALRLRCPVCGQGKMFRGLMSMNKRCSSCGLWFERAPGYFLGSIYVNYGVTTVISMVVYLVPMVIRGRPVTWLLAPVFAFCIVFPVFFFRYARSLWLAFDHYLSPFDPKERLRHED
jgi:uncharacterized protein (DUF983 family)